jgi:hypothetical protein
VLSCQAVARFRRSFSLASVVALAAAACSFDWDAYDPRLGGSPDGSAGAAGTSLGGTAGAAGSASGGSSGASGGAAGTSGGAGGNGGAGGAGGVGGAGGASGGGAGGATGGSAGSSVDAGPQTVTYAASIAECISLTTPDPDACETATGVGLMSVDAQNSALPGTPAPQTAAFVSFAVDGVISGKQVLSVTLELTVASTPNANSPASGEVWEVASFTAQSLSTTVPAQQGSAPIAADQGAVTQNQVVSWTLPTGIVSANQTVHLGIFPIANDGIDYVATGTDGPVLTVQYQ